MDADQEHIGDFIVARAETEKRIAETLLRQAEKDGDYFREKLAAKLLAFYVEESDLFRYFVELKLYYPAIAEELEEQKPYLKEVWQSAVHEFEQFRSSRATQ